MIFRNEIVSKTIGEKLDFFESYKNGTIVFINGPYVCAGQLMKYDPSLDKVKIKIHSDNDFNRCIFVDIEVKRIIDILDEDYCFSYDRIDLNENVH